MMAKSNNPSKLILIVSMLALSLVMLNMVLPKKAEAVSGGEWRAGRIIDDAIFFNKNSMSVQQIQDFLNAKVPNCDRWNPTTFSYAGKPYGPPYTCLKEYQENPSTHENNIGRFNANGTPYNVPGGQSAAQIIYDAAQAYNISPQVLVVMLQKETAIVTDTWAAGWQYDRAMGYGCPDSGPGGTANCNTSYYGFYNQVGNAAWQLRRYVTMPDQYNFKAGVTRNILWNVSGCSSGPVYLENSATAALYNYTPYQPNQAALSNLYGLGDGCSAYGNRNFWRLFNDWFGSTVMPQVVRNPGGSIFIISNGYKFYVPSVEILRDYGTDPGSVPTIGDSYINSIPWANSLAGQSGSLNYLIKTTSETDGDGPTLYVVTAGKKYPVTSMGQFANYNFSLTDISYLPESLVSSIPSGGNLSNFLQSSTNNAFSVNNGQKNLILDPQKYLALNPSNNATFASYFFLNRLNSGDPLTNKSLLIRFSNGLIVLFASGKYYPIASMDAYLCWGFADGSSGQLYQLADDTYVKPSNQTVINSCLAQNTTGSKYLLNKSEKIPLTSQSGLVPLAYNNNDLDSIMNQLSQKNISIGDFIKSSISPGIWKIENGTKRIVPSMKNYYLLGITQTGLTNLDQSAINTIPSGDPILGNGLAVKSPDSSTVYAIGANERIAYQSAEQFLAFGNRWEQIETYSSDLLNRIFPSNGKNLQSYILYPANNQTYLIEASGCYIMSDQMLNNFGKLKSNIIQEQNYSDTVYANLDISKCIVPSIYVKDNDRSTVYKLANGHKQSFSSWNELLADNHGAAPNITILSNNILNSIN